MVGHLVKANAAEHSDTLGSHSNLADGYYSLGRYEEAVRLYKGTVGITERALGREHPDTLNSRDRLANAYRDLER